MSTDAAAERRLHDRLAEVLGPDHAEHLMDRLPPPREELATRADLVATRSELQGDIQAVRSDLVATRSELQADIQAVRSDLVATRSELQVAIATTRADLMAVINQQTRALFFGVIAANATMVAVVLAAVRL